MVLHPPPNSNWQKQLFEEIADIFVGEVVVKGDANLLTEVSVTALSGGTGAPLAPFIGGAVGSGAKFLYSVYLSQYIRDKAGEVYDNVQTQLKGLTLPRHAVAAPPDLTPYKFDEKYYLATYADARQAVASGAASDAYSHYFTVGLLAGYKPNANANPIPPDQIVIRPVTQSPHPPNTSVQSSDGTWITSDGSSITDAGGNVWKINHGRVNVNGADDQTTGRVVALAYKGGKIWQENADKLWWGKSTPSDQWSPVSGTPTPPESVPLAASANKTVVTNDFQAIIDAAQNTWSIANGQVDVNGHLDPTTKNVIELAYTGGAVWQENSSHLWWMKASPSDQWSPTSGTPISPV